MKWRFTPLQTSAPQTDWERGYVAGFMVKATVVFVLGVYAGVLGSWVARALGAAS